MTDTPQTVPFADLSAQYLTIKNEIDEAIHEVIATSAFIRGPHVDQFEQAFADMIGTEHCVSCANGTDALYIAMVALGAKPGDEVVVPAMSWISTSETVTQAGATPVFCDIDPQTNTIDPEKLAACITPQTVGIIPVHLYGHPAKMDEIMALASKHDLWVIEDCAQAHPAEFSAQKVGTFGNAATFSFYPGKNLGAMGDAGAIVTNDKRLADHAAKYARHGGLRKGDHEIEGINSRLDGLQAAILNVKMPHLESWTDARRKVADGYTKALGKTLGLSLPTVANWAKPVWHLYVIRTETRDETKATLGDAGIQTAINYPRALPFLPCYADRGYRPEDFPNAFALSQEGLSLPIFPEMTDAQLDRVVSVLIGVLAAG